MPFTPTTVDLPDRKGSVVYTEDEVLAVLDALQDAESGEGIQCDESQESEGKARTRTRAMKRAIEKHDGTKVREHVVESDGEWLPVLSLPRS